MTSVTDDDLYEDVCEALTQVIDPEIGLDIVTLGLVYGVAVENGSVEVTFTLTTRGCPMERPIRSGIEEVVSQLSGVNEVRSHLVWEPRWHSGRVREGAL